MEFSSLLFILSLLVALYIAFAFIIRPSNNREWSVDQSVLPYVDIDGDNLLFHNVRNFTYRSEEDFDAKFEDRKYKLSELVTADFIIVPFSTLAAHTLVSFGFSDGRHLSVSIEIRKEKGEHFSIIKGLLRQFEIMYVVADECDVIKVRTNHRPDKEAGVYLYPIDVSQEKVREFFLDVVKRINRLHERPEFYNTITNNCLNNLVRHVNRIAPHAIPLSLKYVLPSNSDELIFERGYVKFDGSLDIAESRAKHYITDRARACGECAHFSEAIRDGIGE
jgi:hypothetical protein